MIVNRQYEITTFIGAERGGHRPSVNTLFESVAELEEVNKLAIILTGMGKDGAIGVRKMKEKDKDTIVIVESEETAVIHGIPKAAIQTGCVTEVDDLNISAKESFISIMKEGSKLETSQYLEIFIDETRNIWTLYINRCWSWKKTRKTNRYIEEIFRAAHTLKGMSATMGFDDLANLTHKIENVFDAIRYDKVKVQTEMMDTLFVAVDHLNEMVRDIADGGDGKRDVSDIINRLERIEQGLPLDGETAEEEAEEKKTTPDSNLEIALDEFQITIIEQALEQGFKPYEIYVELSEDSLLKAARVYMVFEILEKHGEVIYSNPSVSDLEEENFDYSFKTIVLTKESSEDIKAKILKVSEIRKVEISDFSLEVYKKEKEEEEQRERTKKNNSKKFPPKRKSSQKKRRKSRQARHPSKRRRQNDLCQHRTPRRIDELV